MVAEQIVSGLSTPGDNVLVQPECQK